MAYVLEFNRKEAQTACHTPKQDQLFLYTAFFWHIVQKSGSRSKNPADFLYEISFRSNV